MINGEMIFEAVLTAFLTAYIFYLHGQRKLEGCNMSPANLMPDGLTWTVDKVEK